MIVNKITKDYYFPHRSLSPPEGKLAFPPSPCSLPHKPFPLWGGEWRVEQGHKPARGERAKGFGAASTILLFLVYKTLVIFLAFFNFNYTL
jgi:hypothetical protein